MAVGTHSAELFSRLCLDIMSAQMQLRFAICDRLHENPPYGINAQFAQCAFLVPKVETKFFVISCLKMFLLNVGGGYGGQT